MIGLFNQSKSPPLIRELPLNDSLARSAEMMNMTMILLLIMVMVMHSGVSASHALVRLQTVKMRNMTMNITMVLVMIMVMVMPSGVTVA